MLTYILFTVILMGFAAFMTGQAVANTWRPFWQVILYGLLLGFADRFLVWGLFGGAGWSVLGYLIDTATLIVIGLLAFQVTRARRMTLQYPWIYERASPLGWRAKEETQAED